MPTFSANSFGHFDLKSLEIKTLWLITIMCSALFLYLISGMYLKNATEMNFFFVVAEKTTWGQELRKILSQESQEN